MNMKFTCEKAILVSALSVASRTVAVKNVISALEGIHVSAGMYLTLTGYNLETGITVKAEAEVLEAGECIFPARLFLEIVRKMPDDMITVTVDEKFQISIRGGISSFTISGSDPEEYPELPDVESEKGITISQRKLREMISGTIFSASENMARPIITGCLFEVTPDSITVVAVDGYRLACRTFHPEEKIDRTLKFVVPAMALKEVEKILNDSENPAIFILGKKHIMFRVGDATLVCRILEGDFLDWRRVLPKNNPIKLVGKISDLTTAMERMALVISEKVKSPVRCKFGQNMADFRTTSTLGAAHDQCSLAGDGMELEIGFNCRYILDALRAVPTPEVTLELSNALSPIVMTPCDGSDDFAYMVLPVRLKAGE